MKQFLEKVKCPDLKGMAFAVLALVMAVPMYISSCITVHAADYEYVYPYQVGHKNSDGEMVVRDYYYTFNKEMYFIYHVADKGDYRLYEGYFIPADFSASGLYVSNHAGQSGLFTKMWGSSLKYDDVSIPVQLYSYSLISDDYYVDIGFAGLDVGDMDLAEAAYKLYTGEMDYDDSIHTSPETLDSDFYFIGFKSDNYINASWQGVSDRTYMTQISPEYYVGVGFGYAYPDSKDIVKNEWLDEEFDYDVMKLTYDITEAKQKYDDMYLRAVYVVPSYKSPGAGWRHGQPSTIFLKEDGSFESISGFDISDGKKDDISSARGNDGISLLDFKVDNYINVSWSGLFGAGVGNDTTVNSFVTVELGYASVTNPDMVSHKESLDNIYMISSGGFTLPISTILDVSKEEYLLYIKVIPYHYNFDDPTARLYQGNASIAYFDVDQNLSWYDQIKSELSKGGGGKRRGTVYLNDFYLKNVNVKESLLGHYIISWQGTTKDSDLLLVPNDDTVVVSAYIVRFPDHSTEVKEYKSVTVGDGSINVDVAKLVKDSENNAYAWDGSIRLCPSYLGSDGVLYMGEQTVVNIFDETVSNEGLDDDGSFKKDDVTDDSSTGSAFSVEGLSNYGNVFIGYLSSLIDSLGQLPNLFAAVFSFLPSVYINSIGVMFIVVLILRVLGR